MSDTEHDTTLIDADAQKGGHQPTGDGEEICPVCDRRITVDPGNGLEYGHRRGARHANGDEDCPRRPKEVEPGNLKKA